ncbi:MAG TPA: HD domain-containing phosphohydrolase [Burkholderiales bacterium]|nr:HD domain-containing phosphohydrolase [Burkholderiales bacterium]
MDSTHTRNGGAADAYRKLIDIGIALSVERDSAKLMETILLEAKAFTNADAGTLYLNNEDRELTFQIVRNDTLDIALGGSSGGEIKFRPVPLKTESGEENLHNVASFAANRGKTINVADAYSDEDEWDFSGTKRFDDSTGYHSKSFLTVPLKNHERRVIGVMQLINARDGLGNVIAFDEKIVPLVEALASQAAVSIDNHMLIEAQRRLLDSFIELIAAAIDAKSPYTGGHCQRVPELTKMLTRAVCESEDAPFREFMLDEDGWYELHIACWLHDCGKVTTPEYVVDKATKLETIYDRIHEVRMRFEVLKRDAEIAYLKGRLEGGDESELREKYQAELAQLDSDFAFIAECNVGGEFMAPPKIERLKQIAERTWTRTLSDRIGISYAEKQRREREAEQPLPVREKLLADRPDHVLHREAVDIMSPDNKWGFRLRMPEHKYNMGEIYNLSIGRGTLNDEERYKINDHIMQTIIMLEGLPFPRHLRRVAEYAGGHHEKMDGTGYPRGLKREDMSIPARVMAIADIFEALTAADRPYKPAKKLSESIKIMGFMVKDQHIDPDLFKLFLSSGVYREYAEKFLQPEQIDEVDLTAYLKA